MNQKLSDWASIAEVVSGIAVVVTLVFLIVGISENTEVTRASMFSNSIESLNGLGRSMIEDPDLSQIWGAFRDGQTADLTEIDQDRLLLIIEHLFRSYDSAFSMQNYDLFGDNEWGRFQQNICINYERANDAGLDGIVRSIATPEFLSYLQASCVE